ncbi:PaaI family thioesterase [Bacillus sp. EB106-08-02-XG196]|uniref:PaaI family thioesterase n=1 Tax=Bacillus sp. EB106-08-02-XG196 TaxID=2737049 RepID=UPI0015C4CB3B|nr:PaaI family thioesterase [Bacillus sp. EB106-08-02-XG196]NWQ42854.1 PaaI family thioesterase [Bacillus sp. EB106-08-02-XG196]
MKMELWKIEEKLMENNNFRKLLGVKIEDISEGAAVLSLSIREDLLQSGNMVHGGVLSVLIDSVIGTAVRTVLDPNEFSVTAEMNINYFRPAIKGKIFAEGKLVNKGKLLIVGTGEIKDEEGRLLAIGKATYAVKKKNV